VIYVIADDLTGANDTGVQFAKQGYNTHVVIISGTDSRSLPTSGSLTENIDVLVVDTETRDTDTSTARTRIRHVLENLNPADEDIIYKKIDSTLRGNIGAELDECLKALKKDICIFTPSFPQNKRITVEGYLIVQDQPLGLSEYYTGDLDPEEASYIPSLLQHDTDFPIAKIDLKDVIQGKNVIRKKIQELHSLGKKILVVDSINRRQLHNILKSSFEFDGSVLYSGSAGLANAFPECYESKRHTKIDSNQNGGLVLIVSGSMRSIAQRQIEYLKEKIDLFDVGVNIEQLLTHRNLYLEQRATDAIQALRDGYHTIIHPYPLYFDKQVTETILLKHQLDFRGLGLAIRSFLGELTASIVERVPASNIILTGGDTAIGVCSALGIYNLNIIDEFLPGIPLSIGQFKGSLNLKIVTKAGGFGEDDTLYVLLEKLV
jgi:uncharacterized protein YgbK (DUF1537 family)